MLRPLGAKGGAKRYLVHARSVLMQPVVEQARAFQEEFAKRLRVSLIPHEQLQPRFQNLVVSSEITKAMHRVRELSRVEMEIPAEDGFTQLVLARSTTRRSAMPRRPSVRTRSYPRR